MPVFENDRPLLDAFRRGERDALERVFNHYVDAISAMVRLGFIVDGKTRVEGEYGRAAQEDLIHEIFLRAFRKSARAAYDGLRPYKPYLSRIARNLLIDRARRSGREVILDDDSLEATIDIAAPEPTLDDDHDWRRLRAATQEYLAQVDTQLAEFIRQRYVEGLSQYQVADAMKITRGKVRFLEKTAENGLSKHLKSKGLLEILEGD